MRILIPTDVFPPFGQGGAAWSSHALARALLAHGHSVTAIVPMRGQPALVRCDDAGVPALRVGYRAPRLPFVQNYFRHERFWPLLAQAIVHEAQQDALPDLIHAQHVQVAPAAVLAGRRLGLPVVVTVRDHWPWHYFATGLHGDRVPLAATTWATLVTELLARLGPLGGLLALPAVPYMLAHLRRRAAYLAQAHTVIAVSHYIAGRLAGIVAPERIRVLPNMVDIPANDALAATPPATTWDGKLLLFVGKLEANKGAGLLPAIFRALRNHAPSALPNFTLVIAGDGALRQQLAAELAALAVPTQFLAWADHSETLRLMAHCDLLLFPSQWGEPLSRVLLEAATLGAPILAMPTGGTPDIIRDGVTGLFAPTAAIFAARLATLLRDEPLRRRLSHAVRQDARQRFAVTTLLPRYEALYAHCALDKGPAAP
ncbi:MAG: glycosyltransferase family 1 protein [Candidatus Viridilinea halotolerans]|uniref:Glycosyltransferase family 1 protein n=1 Tax=Candidatus Viridilinea halotolerans TaxID=2491704 RepID=A0A426TZG2_9CHLR|nr:MAG: glycosyltransferase family 1 protein [Candidatus Viridilinea halotolerans]